jgi:3-hydroxyisobutyryl-CoA hydrolase
MPETAIGFFADVGGSYFLSRLRDKIGIYLVLTGNRLKGKDVKRTGIATHYMDSSVLGDFEKKLFENKNKSIEDILSQFDEKITDEFDTKKILANFNESRLEKIIENLEKENSDWSKQQLKLLSKMSPSSLKVAIKQLEVGLNKSLKECLEMEYQLCLRFCSKNDFSEGVRAVLIDRGDKPKWSPASLNDIDDKLIDWYFKPLSEDDKLILPNSSKL